LRQTEQRLRLAMDAANAGTWEWYLESNENFWSDEIWKLYGLQENTVAPSFDVWKNCVHPNDLERVLAILDDAVAKQAEFEMDWQVRLPANESPRWLLSRGQPIRASDGKLSHYIGIVVDISARKRAEIKLEQHRNELEQLVENRTAELSSLYNQAPCGYHSLDRDGTFIKVNDTELSWIGYTREEIIGRKHAVEILSPDSKELFEINFPKLLETGELAGLECEFVRKDGSLMPILLHARALYDSQGQFSHTLSTIIDNTGRKEAEKAWITAREAAESANRAKSVFLANMSHEIRTPLSAIIGLSHIMKRGSTDPTQANYLSKIDNSAHHLLAVINDILDLSKIEADKFILEESDFNVLEAAQNVASMLYEQAAKKSVSLSLEGDQFPSLLRGDPTRFTQALLNLVGNAVKFTDHGAIVIRIRQQPINDNQVLVRTEVEDNGIGIAADDLQRLFRPFEQVDGSQTRRYSGTGLGLAITRRLAELMGGKAGVESTPGKGSTFWFTTRLKIVTAKPLMQEESKNHEPDKDILKKKFAGLHILVVEDEPINQLIATTFLEDVGMEVKVANNGLEALNLVAAEPFALILMDMQMPEMDGIEATRKIRQLPNEWNTVPIVAMTANAFTEDRAKCLEAGMNDFITKPIYPENFYTLLLFWLRK